MIYYLRPYFVFMKRWEYLGQKRKEQEDESVRRDQRETGSVR